MSKCSWKKIVSWYTSKNSFLSRVDMTNVFEGAAEAWHLKRLIDGNEGNTVK